MTASTSRASAATIHVRSDILAAVCLTVIGFVGLLIGNVGPDDRLVISGLPLNTFIYVFFFAALFYSQPRKDDLRLIFLYAAPLALLAPTILYSYDQAYGLFKYANLILVQIFCCAYWVSAIRVGGLTLWLKTLNAILFFLMMAALVFKLRYGFFDRQVPFFMNGPIVFGRLMGVGVILSMVIHRGWLRVALIALFLFGVFWSASKGPILATMVIVFLAMNVVLSVKGRLIALGLISVFVGGAIWAALAFGDGDAGRIVLLLDLLTMDREALAQSSSISIRASVYLQSWELVASKPFGVGLGGWAPAISDPKNLYYPHNLFLELFSEAGLFLGLVALIPFVAFVVFPKSPLKYIALFFLIVQQVSGDLLDARYITVFGFFAVWVHANVGDPSLSIQDSGIRGNLW
ncbi:MAG: O-antigen ligase family protein [Pseudomonadota bacterium]